ncbi:MAG TPA: lamin tail domain-containing protein [Kouleothrix sp.]|nr:lamin tail domain-containing protein [Kouleothrix sp.]
MKRKLFAFSMTVALLLSMLSVASVGAHTITIENAGGLAPARTDWFGPKPVTGVGAVQRNNAQQGEFVFGDALKVGSVPDARQITATNSITRAANLDFFSVTADPNKIYFLAKVDRYQGITQDPSINLIITIDTNHTANTGRLDVPVGTGTFSTTNVPANAAWENAINLQFKKGSAGGVVGANKVLIYDAANPAGKSCGSCSGQLASSAVAKGSFVELSVPWTALTGVKPAANTLSFLRFTVATTYNNLAIPPDGYNSPIIDVLSSSTSKNTLQEIQDGALDTSFDVYFDTNVPVGGAASYEPYSPLLITEFQANPIGKDTPGSASTGDSEWIEVYNPNNFAVPLTDFKIGNAATRSSSTTSSQGMYQFKSGNLASKALLVVARNRTDFKKARPTYAGTLLDLTADFTKYNSWAAGNLDLDNINSLQVEDQIVLLGSNDGIVDLVNYGNPVTPTAGNIPIRVADVPESVSYERCPSGLDTNGGFIDGGVNDPVSNTDFITRGSLVEETPGQICEGRPGLDNAIAKRGPDTASPGTEVGFELTYSNIGSSDEFGGAKATIVDTLPADMTFVAAALPDGTPLSPLVNGQDVTFTVDAPLHGGIASTIILTATVSPTARENTAMTNKAVISSPHEPKDATTQSNNQSEWTVTTLGPALLDTYFTPTQFAAPPGRDFAFTLNYSNGGQSVADGIQITLDVPAGVRINSVNSGGATPTFSLPVNGPTTLTWTVDQLDAIQNDAITVNGTVLSTTAAGASLPFSATVSSTTAGVASANASATLKAEFIKIFLPMARK